jgi:hypothetical protein
MRDPHDPHRRWTLHPAPKPKALSEEELAAEEISLRFFREHPRGQALTKAVSELPELELRDQDDTNEEFCFGDFAIGFYTPWSGLLLSADWKAPEPGFLLIVGPFQLWYRRGYGASFSFLDNSPIWYVS